MAGALLVVARFREPVGWLSLAPAPWEPLVVTKGVELPNEGREASSWLWAMRQPAVRRARVVAFVQGNPFDHAPDLWRALGEPVDGFRWLGRGGFVSDADGNPWHAGLPVGRLYEEWTERRFPGEVEFAAGAQFVIPGGAIAAVALAELERLQRRVCEEPDGPWVLERIWPAVLSTAASTVRGVIPRDEGAPVTKKKPAPEHHAPKSKTPTPSPKPKPKPHAPASTKPIAARALAEAAKFIGVTEHPFGSNRTQFGEWFGENGVAWCAIFVSYCLEVGAGYVLCHEFQGPGVVPGKGCAYVPTIEGWAKDTGKFVPRDRTPQVGDLALFNWNGGPPDHIGIVEKVHPDGSFDTIEGNTEDGAHTAGGGYVLRQKGRSPRLVDGFVRIAG